MYPSLKTAVLFVFCCCLPLWSNGREVHIPDEIKDPCLHHYHEYRKHCLASHQDIIGQFFAHESGHLTNLAAANWTEALCCSLWSWVDCLKDNITSASEAHCAKSTSLLHLVKLDELELVKNGCSVEVFHCNVTHADDGKGWAGQANVNAVLATICALFIWSML